MIAMTWSDIVLGILKANDVRLVLLAVKIDDLPGKVQTVRDPSLIRSRFVKGLGTGRGGALDA
jgi:hypothetical protein